jgi:uncharacterized protein YkwD/uncharacterized protein YukE
MNDNLKDETHYQKRAIKRLWIIAIAVVIVGGIALYVVHSGSFQKISSLENSAQHLAAEEFSKTFSAPPPLIATTTAPTKTGSNGGGGSTNSYTLTRAGVITATNAARHTNGGLSALSENATLNDIASLRLDDMFAKQYFAHVSPSSSSAETVAAAVGYDYIALGENLALGDFVGDQGVVTAWMNSPGHRANILNTHYSQIGVAVGEGAFQGSDVWIAVQIFGRPLADCPALDTGLKSQIDDGESQTTAIQTQLQSMQAQMDAMDPKSGDTYTEEANSYNALVDQYNTLIAQLKTDIAQYNTEVDAYNQCIGAATVITTSTSSQ